MQVRHYKLLIAGQPSFRTVRDMLPSLTWQPGRERGFLLKEKESNQNRVKGDYIYTKFSKVVSLDEETLEQKEEQVEELTMARFEIDQKKGLVMCEKRRGELNALFEALDSIPEAHVSFEELNLNLLDMIFEIQSAYKKNEIKSVKIRDYLAREHMIANATFKIIAPQDGERILEKFSDQLDAVTLVLKMPDGAVNLTVTRKGTVRCSDDAPDELLLFVKDLLPRFHEAEVETAEVVDPSPKQRTLAGVR